MRYDTKMYFVQEVEDVYNEDTGDYSPSTPLKDSKWVNVSDMGIERMNAVFGRIRRKAITIRMQGEYLKNYDYIQIGEDKYDVGLTRTDRRGTTIEAGDRA